MVFKLVLPLRNFEMAKNGGNEIYAGNTLDTWPKYIAGI